MKDDYEKRDKEDRLLSNPNITRKEKLKIYVARAKREQRENFIDELPFIIIFFLFIFLFVYILIDLNN